MTDGPFKPNVPIKINVGNLDSDNPGNTLYHTVRYHFKPQSIKKDSLNGTVAISMDSAAKENKVEMKLGQSVFTGSYEIKKDKQASHECALVYNSNTNSFTIQVIYYFY